MKNLTNFLKYNNLMPIVLGVVFLGGGAALAAPQIGEMIGSPTEVENEVLLNVDVENFDFSPTVTAVEETEDTYLVSYEITTLSPVGESWEMIVKVGQFTVSKSSLDDTGLQGKVVAKLRDLENAEKTFLARAQVAERNSIAASRPASVFAALIGRTPDDIRVPERERLPGELSEAVPSPDVEQDEKSISTSTESVKDTPVPSVSTSTSTSTDEVATSSPGVVEQSDSVTEPETTEDEDDVLEGIPETYEETESTENADSAQDAETSS